MGVREAFAHDFGVIWKAIKWLAFQIGRILFFGLIYFFLALVFVYHLFVAVVWVLTIRDAVQWFLGTNRRRR